MSVIAGDTRRRWTSVAVAVAALCALPVGLSALPARGGSQDPAVLRDRILAADVPYRGYAETVGSLGLPDLAELGRVSSLLGDRTRLRVWHASPTAWRVDVLTETGERDQYATEFGVASWDYERNLRTDLLGFPMLRLPRPGDLLPPELARRLLGGPRTETRLERLPPRRAAGRSAVGLRLVPTDPDTVVGHVDVWADPRTALPVLVTVTGQGGGPASLRSEFLDLDAGPGTVPAAAVTPPDPAGAQRAVGDAPQIGEAVDRADPVELPARLAGRPSSPVVTGQPRAVRTYGAGYTTFAAAGLPPQVARGVFEAARRAGANRLVLPTGRGEVAEVLRTELLLLVVLAPDGAKPGFVLAGPVSERLLLTAAGELSGTLR